MSAAPDSTPSVFAQWAARQTNGPYGTSLPRAALPGENLNPISGMPVPTTPSPQSNSVFAQWADKQQMQKMGQYQEQQVQAHAPGGLKGYLNAAAKSAVGPMENLFSRLHNHFVSEVTGNELVNMDRTGPADPAFAQAQVRTQQDIDQNRTNLNAMLPTNPANWGTKLGNIHGAVAGPMLASTLMPGAMVPVMVAQGAENRTETVENNPNLSALQKAAYVGGGMIWDAVLGKMVPAGPLAATASRGIFPATGRALVQGAIGAGEGAGYVAGETALARATGADPNRPWIDPTQTATMGIMRGATSVAGEAAHPNPFTEARARVEELKAQEAKPAEAENAKPAVPAGPLARAAEVRPPETPQGEPNFAAAAFENPAGEVQPPVEAKPETPEGPKAAPEVPPEFAGAKFLTPKEARTPDRPPTTLGELLKGNPAIRNLSEETLRTPVYFSTRLRGAHGDAKGVERSRCRWWCRK